MAGVGCEVSELTSNIQHLTSEVILSKTSVSSVVPKTQIRVNPHHPPNPRSILFEVSFYHLFFY